MRGFVGEEVGVSYYGEVPWAWGEFLLLLLVVVVEDV